MLKYILSTIVGLVVAMACVFVIELISHNFWPPPEGLSATSDRETLRAAVASMPAAALAAVAFSWLAGAFTGGIVASKLSESKVPAYVVGGFVALAGVSNLLAIPHPFWFWIVALVLVPAAAIVAAKLGTKNAKAK